MSTSCEVHAYFVQIRSVFSGCPEPEISILLIRENITARTRLVCPRKVVIIHQLRHPLFVSRVLRAIARILPSGENATESTFDPMSNVFFLSCSIFQSFTFPIINPDTSIVPFGENFTERIPTHDLAKFVLGLRHVHPKLYFLIGSSC